MRVGIIFLLVAMKGMQWCWCRRWNKVTSVPTPHLSLSSINITAYCLYQLKDDSIYAIKLLWRVMGAGIIFLLVGRVCCDVDGTKWPVRSRYYLYSAIKLLCSFIKGPTSLPFAASVNQCESGYNIRGMRGNTVILILFLCSLFSFVQCGVSEN